MTESIYRPSGEGQAVDIGPSKWLIKAASSETAGACDVFEGRVGHLEGPPLHVHKEQMDMFYVVSGRLKVQVGDKILDLGPGDFAGAPAGVPHTYANVEVEPAHVINVMAPGGFSDGLIEVGSWPPGPPPAGEGLEAFAEKYQLKIVGPPIPVVLGLVGGPA